MAAQGQLNDAGHAPQQALRYANELLALTDMRTQDAGS
jgi:hypothetical protein